MHKVYQMAIFKKSIFYLLLICTIWIGYLFSQKDGLHVDEIWSYGFSNSTHGGYFYTYNIGEPTRLVDHWSSKEDIKKYLTVQKGERFNYANTYKNFQNDVHPPLYFFLLHTVSSFFPDTIKPWHHAFINIIFFFTITFFII